ncbi:Membrane fusogenic activity [Hartmannibacter diazotrophicus]|uniref:Membrane fusogenic activity n=1 Tax=Hartmannibacter diazotrophicus TaxID=1482074 RepID=A0A2C9DA45_9HYPH|nr:accessory factor UbiK family protein [Hartmannibacter diazotrophicus]SON57059.1 Membrane fusogenic activity [Hartmannibacter diazotrophicus]
MSQTQGRLFEEFAKLMQDAAGVAQGAQREMTTMFRAQGERIASEMDLARKEDVEIVRELAAKALAEIDRLNGRVAELEARLEEAEGGAGAPKKAARAKTTKAAKADD